MTIHLEGVQQTLLLPLWSRSRLTVEGNSILLDPKAVEIVQNIPYDFDQIDKTLPYVVQIMNLVRARMFDDAIAAFLIAHPGATVVNLGAGLDTTFSRVDNGLLTWYDIDLPDVIQLRKQLIPETDRSHCIAESIFDMNWVKRLQRTDQGVFLVSGGVLEYFDKGVVRQFLSDLAASLPGSQIVFNTTHSSPIARLFVNRGMQRLGIQADSIHWGLDFIRELQAPGSGITLIDQFPVFSRIELDPKWGQNTIRKLKFLDALKAINIVHLQLGPVPPARR